MFQVTTKNLYDLKKDENGSIIYDDDFFGKQASLTVSGQLEGELAATALGAIYTFGPTFRAENSNTPRHLAEFWMIDRKWRSMILRTIWTWRKTSSSIVCSGLWTTVPTM